MAGYSFYIMESALAKRARHYIYLDGKYPLLKGPETKFMRKVSVLTVPILHLLGGEVSLLKGQSVLFLDF